MSIGVAALSIVLVALIALAAWRREDPGPIFQRLIEQLAKLLPKMLVALVAAGFIAQLIPKQAIASLLGDDAGLMSIPVAFAAGLIVPAGPVISFAIAAVFARAGASPAALVAFITSWTLFGAHRMLIYELPLLGPSFLRLRVLSVVALPFIAGLIAWGVHLELNWGVPVLAH